MSERPVEPEVEEEDGQPVEVDAPFNAADPAMVNKRAKAARLKDRQADEDFKELMGNPSFRRFMWAVLADVAVFQASYVPGIGGTDLAYNEGKRDVGRALLARMNKLSPDEYVLMLKEGAEQ